MLRRAASFSDSARSITSISAFLLVTVLAGCGDDGNDLHQPAAAAPAPAPEAGDDSGTAPTPEVAPTGVVVNIQALDNSFRPQVTEAKVGDEVVWENRGINEHNVLSIEGDEWGVTVDDFQPDDTFSHVFTEPGEYRYYCSIHGSDTVGMVGTITITD